MPLADGQAFAGYTILRVLGTGGMGEVYLAEHPRLPRRDALKVLGTEVSHDAEYRQRFNQEAEMVATLRHPNIVTIYDRGDSDGQLWIAMEFIDGTDAFRLMSEQYRTGVPAEQVVHIVTAVADALDYAHSRDVLHRDIKPANILLGRSGSGIDPVMLADFGVAAESAYNDRTKHRKDAYLSPEQARSRRYGSKADMWAVGCILVELACCQRLKTDGSLWDDASEVNDRRNKYFAQVHEREPVLGDIAKSLLDRDETSRLSASELRVCLDKLKKRLEQHEEAAEEERARARARAVQEAEDARFARALQAEEEERMSASAAEKQRQEEEKAAKAAAAAEGARRVIV
jgi:serine/threonine protein kinase